ncbi:MAG: hybrid sensor histidine kinase/response regulator [Coleofasciculus sp. G2-EDA-02]
MLQIRKFDEAKTAEALATIERNANLQIELIDDLLDIAKILRGKLSLDMTSVNLSSVIEAAIYTVRTTAVAKSISLHSALPNIGQVSGDAARLQQIVWNLLSNAIKFTPNGELLTVLLTEYGAEVLTVACASQVIANLKSFQPDVLISDIGMPDVDGYTLLEQIRVLPAEKGGQIPAIALTAYARLEDQQRAFNSGYQRHVPKSLEPEQLVRAVAVLAQK